EMLVVDLGVLAVGPVVDDVSRDFERYWTSASAWPASRVLPPAGPRGLTGLTARAETLARAPEARDFIEALETESHVKDLLAKGLSLAWARTRMVSDAPAKGLSKEKKGGLLWNRLQAALGTPERELCLVSPYFVPTGWGVSFFGNLVRRGVRVSVLTNALESTDVLAVH